MVNPTPYPSPRRVLDVVAHMYGYDVEQLVGPGRRQPLALRRQIAAWLMRDVLGLSYSQIAEAVGRSDHTTAMHAIDRVDELLGEDEQLWRQIETLKDLINDPPPMEAAA